MTKILFIEDNQHLVETYDFLFTQQGYQVLWAHDGLEGLNLANTENPDVIILDMMMPLLSGIDFLKQYDVKNLHPDAKIIAFSNMQTDEYIHEAIQLGVLKYEIKSNFSPKKLVALVMDVLGDTSTTT